MKTAINKRTLPWDCHGATMRPLICYGDAMDGVPLDAMRSHDDDEP